MPANGVGRRRWAQGSGRRLQAVIAMVALLLLAGGAPAVQGRISTPPATPGATPTVHQPTPVNGRFRLPPDAHLVIESSIGNGSLPPAFQFKTTITIDARGKAVVTDAPSGALAPTPTARTRTMTRELGQEALQPLLTRIATTGFFALPQPGQPGAPVPLLGGPTSELTVTLADGTWTARGPADDAGPLGVAQALVAQAVGLRS